ncbi:hypothetical protein ASG48_08915 [Aurantimonas sp. Leaf443]|nr:hypothetical protein ASG48_08915 [Aurantimonas sp. Leaf443]
MRVSLRSVGIEPEIVRVPWKITAREQQNEASIEAEDATFDNDVTFFVMPAFDTTLMLAKSGPKAFGAKRRIGFWQWELEKFPEPAKIAMDLVDEIWCHSEHSAKAFRSATDKPVIKVPLPVIVPTVRQASRSEFGLPDDCFIIFTSFDGASAIARKNPLGAIEAFGKAFPAAEHPDKRLVVKAMNTAYDSLWRECLRRAELDDRILIREGVLDKDDYYALLTSCDAILSLHRSEGFGRLMAEGMALGIPVIATGYSGNMDFMNEGNSWPVGGSLVTVLAGDYAFHQDQVWMQPDTDLAAAALLECATNPGLRATKIEAARRTIEAYSPEACGRRYRQLLDEGPSATA